MIKVYLYTHRRASERSLTNNYSQPLETTGDRQQENVEEEDDGQAAVSAAPAAASLMLVLVLVRVGLDVASRVRTKHAHLDARVSGVSGWFLCVFFRFFFAVLSDGVDHATSAQVSYVTLNI